MLHVGEMKFLGKALHLFRMGYMVGNSPIYSIYNGVLVTKIEGFLRIMYLFFHKKYFYTSFYFLSKKKLFYK